MVRLSPGVWVAVAVVAALAAAAHPAYADLQSTIDQQTAAAAGAAGAEELGAPLPIVIAKIINAALALLGAIFFALMVYGGFLWMTARGEHESLEKAQETMRRAVIGLIIVLAAYAITKFITSAVATGTGG